MPSRLCAWQLKPVKSVVIATDLDVMKLSRAQLRTAVLDYLPFDELIFGPLDTLGTSSWIG